MPIIQTIFFSSFAWYFVTFLIHDGFWLCKKEPKKAKCWIFFLPTKIFRKSWMQNLQTNFKNSCVLYKRSQLNDYMKANYFDFGYIAEWPNFDGFCMCKKIKKGPRNSSGTPRNRLCVPRSPRSVKLPFLDSSIPRGVKFSEELPFLFEIVLVV